MALADPVAAADHADASEAVTLLFFAALAWSTGDITAPTVALDAKRAFNSSYSLPKLTHCRPALDALEL